jgi:hypothetical protein
MNMLRKSAVLLAVMLLASLTPGIGHAATASVVGKVCQSLDGGVVKTCEWESVEYNQTVPTGIKDLEESAASITTTSSTDVYIIENQSVYIGVTGKVADVLEQSGDEKGSDFTASGVGSVTYQFGKYETCGGNDSSRAYFKYYGGKAVGWVTTGWGMSTPVSLSAAKCLPGGIGD